MDYLCLLQSAVSYIESRVREDIDQAALCRSFGISEAHFRDVFAARIGTPPGQFVRGRKIANAAYEIAHTDRKIIDIASDYGFESPDTFTRAFRREAGITPSAFRAERRAVGRIRLSAGAYGPGIAGHPARRPSMEESMENTKDGCVLYGVRKVQYCYEECTPFPAMLRSCLNYLGQDVAYPYLMVATGAAFRLRWHASMWDGGNVDISNVYTDPMEAYERGFRMSGRSFKMLARDAKATKETFKDFIVKEIDAGRPVIAFGIIGPPEACLVTGYRSGGDVLLGWNCFQENPEFAGGCSIDESGYFVTDRWWENPDTRLLMSVGETAGDLPTTRELLENALAVLVAPRVTHADGSFHWGGQEAYRAWAEALSDDGEFALGTILPKLFERLMCNNDALTMVGEGRAYAAVWMRDVASGFKNEGKDELSSLALKASVAFDGEYALVGEIFGMEEYREPGEKQARALASPAVRNKIVERIRRAAELDAEATTAIGKILAAM